MVWQLSLKRKASETVTKDCSSPWYVLLNFSHSGILHPKGFPVSLPHLCLYFCLFSFTHVL